MKPEILFIGMNKKQAEIMASRLGYTFRIISENGVGCVGTNDLESDRVNVIIENDIVIDVQMG